MWGRTAASGDAQKADQKKLNEKNRAARKREALQKVEDKQRKLDKELDEAVTNAIKAAATAIAKAEAAGQLGVVAITTKMAHALKIVSRQLRARRTFDVRRAAARMGYGNTPGASPATTPSSRGGALAASGGGTRTRWASSSLSSSLPSAEIEPIRQAGIAAGVARSYSCAPAVPVRTTAATMESARPLAASNAMNAFAAAAGGGGTKPAGRRATVAASVVGDLEDD